MNTFDRRRGLPFAWALVVGLVVLLIPGLALARVTLPARIQAEDYDTQSGALTTTTGDVDGGDDIYCMWIGDWTEYEVSVPSTAEYTITVRANNAWGSGNVFRIEIDDVDVTGTIGTTQSGVYEDVVVENVELTSGNHDLKFYQVNGWGYESRVNWIEVEAENAAPTVDAGTTQSVNLPSNATLDGTVSDDGLPNPPATYTVTWTKQSGPGTVTFGNVSAVDTTAAFSVSGAYVLRLTASDSALETYDEVTINVNSAPSVEAGSNQTITWPTSQASLDATVSDDSLPNPPAAVTTTWTKQSGPGTVTFANSAAVDTTATFSASGSYVLRLTANDSAAQTYDEVTITVNAAPTVDVGSDLNVTLPDSATLDATVTDDGLPSSPGTYTVTWTKQSGAGTVTFGNSAAVDTTAEFSEAGTYVLRLTAGDGDTTTYDEVQVTVASGAWSLTIQAEDYDDQSGADTTETDDVDGDDDLYCMWIGDWTEYEIEIPSSGDYDITVRALNCWSSGNVFRIEIDDEDVTGTFGPTTSATYQDCVVEDVSLTAGSCTLKYYQVNGWGYESRVNWIKLENEGGASNAAPSVEAGSNQTITWPTAQVSLDGTVTDDGLPNPPGAVTTTWTKQSGAGTVTFGDSSAVDTTAAFSATGTYVLRLTADDNDETAYDEVTITVNAAPTVDAGVDQCIAPASATATLDATVSDDGLPSSPGTYTVTWTMQSGPGTVTFGNASAVDTTATFSAAGTYVLRLTAGDGDTQTYDDVTIGVSARTTLPAKIQAEDYRYGASGLAYYDTTSGNTGGEYRSDDVDIYLCTDSGGGYEVRRLVENEWLAFDVNVPSTDYYDISFRVKTDGENRDLHVEIDGQDVTGTVTVVSSGTYGTTIEESVQLTSGDHVIKIVFEETWLAADAINWIEISPGNFAPTVDAGENQNVDLPGNATLDATVTDDSLPNPPGTYTVTWTKQSGPGTVTFGNASAVDTTAAFSESGTYVLRLTADDGDKTTYDDVTIWTNSVPTVNAGSDQSINLPNNATLDATVTDDDLPNPPGAVTTTWTKQSGPGTVVFGDDSLIDTTASFSESGTYVLRLTADDGSLTAYDELTITANAAPIVNAGVDQDINLPSNATLDATVTDDDLPDPPDTVTTTWTKQSGPGTVTFGNASAVDTTAAFSVSGTYVLRLTADDSALTAYDEVTIVANAAPTVDAGSNQSVNLPSNASLDGTVSDDDLPDPPAAVTTTWTKQSGPGTVTFGNASAVDTTAAFSASGTYVLRLTADDSVLTDYDDVTISVNSPPTVDAGLDDTVTYPADATLDATVTDDGLPNPPGTYTVTWTKQSGPGTVTFGSASAVDTTAAFDTVGTYVLRLTADDDDATTYDEVTITVAAGTGWSLTIQAEDYDDQSGAATISTDDVDGGDDLYSMWIGDWTEYEIEIPSSGDYDITVRALDKYSSGGKFRIEIDDEDVTGTIGCTTSNVYQDVLVEDVSLTAGSCTLKYYQVNGWGYESRVNWIKLENEGGASNAAPSVEAGSNQTITWPTAQVSLDGTVTDDGLPSTPGTVTTTWTKQSGAGTVTFGSTSVEDTTAAFSATGTYVLRLTADDGDETAYDEVTIVVNDPPSVNAGSDDSITWPTNTYNLDGTVSDDGLPSTPGTVTTTWTKQSGPGTVTFNNASAVDTTATFSEAGAYVLRLTADDGDAQPYDDVQITVSVSQANNAPVVDAGDDDAINLSSSATLDGEVTDDGLPNPPGTYTVTWTKQSGPGTVTFGSTSAEDTTATFSATGTYVLRLTADDSDETDYDEVTIIVVENGRVILPARIQAEDYDDQSGVSTTTTGDVDGGDDLRALWIGDWASYDVYAPSAGQYTITVRVKSPGNTGEFFRIEIDDEDVTGTIGPNIGDEYRDVTVTGINITAGAHELKYYQVIGWSFDARVNWIEVSSDPNDAPVVDAGSNYSITLPENSVAIDATITDDDLPNPPAAVTARWTITSRPESGYVDFSDLYAADTTVTFDTAGVYVLRLTADDSDKSGYDEMQVTVSEATGRVTLPGRLEAEDYSDQGEGVSYHDTTAGNAGSVYRSDDVDIEACGDSGGGYNVYAIVADEWLAFDVNVPQTKCYDIVARVNSSTSSREMHVEVDGTDVTGTMTFDSTGGWANVSADGIHLTAGNHIVKVVMDTGDFKLNYVDILAETYEEYIVQNNTANADIVISSSATRSAVLAADELQTIIEDITGATLPIVTTETGADVHIYVGQSSYTDNLGISTSGLEHDAYKMVSGSDWIALLGQDDNYTLVTPTSTDSTWDTMNSPYLWMNPYGMRNYAYDNELDIWNSDGKGSLNAVYAFLYDLGCRWYFPGTIGEIHPDLDDIGLPEVNRTVEPDFALREFFQYYTEFGRSNNADEVRWQMRLGLNDGRDSIGVGPRGHGIAYVIARNEYATSHPEYYLLLNGTRQSGSGEWSKPCLSSTGLLAENVEFVETLFDHYGEPMVNVSPSDGYGSPCECALCEGKDTPERGNIGLLSDYVWGYVNDLAEDVYLTYPSKKVSCLAYTTYYLPPEDIETMSPNIVVTFCRWRSWFEEQDRKLEYEDAMDDWMDKLPSDEFFIWDYYLHARPPGADFTGIPVYYPWIIRDDLRFLEGKSLGDYIEVQRNWPAWNLPYNALAANHLNCYLTARLYWDPEQDVNGLIEEYYTKFYGDAADEMKTFVEYCEANWLQAAIDKGDDDYTRIEQMRTYLDAAITAAGTGNDADRVALLDSFLQAAENELPEVGAGDDDSVTLPANASLDGTVTDDGLPEDPGTVTTTWSMQSGPGTVTFGNASAVDTTAAFSTAGTYVLRLSANDGLVGPNLAAPYDDVTITVSE